MLKDLFMAKFEYSRFLDLLLEFKYHEFEWDLGNQTKSFDKHNISVSEAEEIFYDDDLLALGKQIEPKPTEPRYGVIGKNLNGKILFACFTIRNGKIRVISARIANKTERLTYES